VVNSSLYFFSIIRFKRGNSELVLVAKDKLLIILFLKLENL
jgi:hypothetical protein